MRCSEDQAKAIRTLAEVLGWDGQRLLWFASELVGRPVERVEDLTAHECYAVIDAMDRIDLEGDERQAAQ